MRGIVQLSRNVSNPVPSHMPDIPVSSPGKKEIEEIEKDWEKMQKKSCTW